MLIYPSCSKADKKRRNPRYRISSEAQQKLNYKRSFEELEETVALNFPDGFYFVTVTYDDDHLPETRERANYLCNKLYMNKLKRQWARKGGELKRITATQQVQSDGSLRLHHHIILNRCDKDDFDTIKSLWTYGDIMIEWCTGNDQITDKALYMTHEPRDHGKPKKCEKAWSCSQNLLRPRDFEETMEVPDEVTITAPYDAFVVDRSSIRNQYGEYTYIKCWVPNLRGPCDDI